MKKGKGFSAGWFIFIVTIALVLPGAALADFSGSWSVNSTAPVMGCSYSGPATVSQVGLSVNGSLDLSFTGSGCPPPITIPLTCTLLSLTTPANFTCLDYSSPPINVTGIKGVITTQSNASGSVLVAFGTQTPVPSDWEANKQVLSVPTMTEWGVIIFIMLAGLGAIYFIRRNKRTES